MPAEGLTDMLDGVDQSVTRALLAQVIADRVDELSPVDLAHTLVDARVSDHRQFVIRHRDVDEHAVTLSRAVHAESLEHLDGPPERVLLAGVVEVHAHLGRGARLGSPHRARDISEILLGEKRCDPPGMPSHHQSPLAPPPPKLPPPPPKSPPPPPPSPPPPPMPPPHPPGKMIGPPQPREPPVHPCLWTCDFKSAGTMIEKSPATTMKRSASAMKPWLPPRAGVAAGWAWYVPAMACSMAVRPAPMPSAIFPSRNRGATTWRRIWLDSASVSRGSRP